MGKRIKQRAGLPKRAHAHFLCNAKKYGLKLEDFSDSPNMYNYLRSIKRDGYSFIIYNLYIVVISDTGIGVTLFNLPKEYHEIVKAKEKG